MTERDEAIVTYVLAYYREVGLPPTMHDIADHIGLASKSEVHRRLGKLVEAGKLVRVSRGRFSTYVPTLEQRQAMFGGG